MRVLADTEWADLLGCDTLAQNLYLFLRNQADDDGCIVEYRHLQFLRHLEAKGDWASRDRMKQALRQLERRGLIESVSRRPHPRFRLPWVWPAELANLACGVGGAG